MKRKKQLIYLEMKRKKSCYNWARVRVMVFNDTFKNISVISWKSVLSEYLIPTCPSDQ